jgi:hypothetical protein
MKNEQRKKNNIPYARLLKVNDLVDIYNIFVGKVT